MKIYIDAGHGGRDPGAVGNGMRESDIVLEVSRTLGNILTQAGVDVRYSRTDDSFPAISERWGAANSWGADYFISIHANAGGGTGAETFIAATKQGDRAFAQAVNDTLAAAMGLRNRGVKLDTQAAVGSLGVLRNTRMPALLIELAFIDSPASNPDVNILRNRRADMAQALAKGILEFTGMQTGTLIRGSSVISPDVIAAFIRRRNASFNGAIAGALVRQGKVYGVRGDIACCQSIIETGWFRFDGGTAVTLEQNNFCGLGVTSLGVRGNSFATIDEGAEAQIQHLFAYAATDPLPGGRPIVSPRWHLVTRGIAPRWVDLNMRWAMSNDYGQKILAMYDDLTGFAAKHTPANNQEDLTMSQYNELKGLIDNLKNENENLKKAVELSRPRWGYMTDADFPERLKPIVQRMYDSSTDFRLPNGSLGVSRDMARFLIALDDLGFFGKGS